MSDGTRRVFLSTSSLGAAAVGVAALTPTLVRAAGSAGGTENLAAALPDTSALTGSLTGSLVAFVSDVRAGEVSLMVGEEEIVVQDKELVTRLLRATGR